MIKLVFNISRWSNVALVAFIRTFLTKLAKVPFFHSPEVQAQAKVVQEYANLLETAYTSDSAHRASHARKERKNLDKEMPLLLNLLEMMLGSSGKTKMECTTLAADLDMKLQRKQGGMPRVFKVMQGSEPNTVKMVAKGGRSTLHQWQYTSDIENFTNRIALEHTLIGTTEATNLKRGVYAFFHKVQVKGTTSGWEGPLYFLVTENAEQIVAKGK